MKLKKSPITTFSSLILGATVLYWIIAFPINKDIKAAKIKRKSLADAKFEIEEKIGDFQFGYSPRNDDANSQVEEDVLKMVLPQDWVLPTLYKALTAVVNTDFDSLYLDETAAVVEDASAPEKWRLYKHSFIAKFSTKAEMVTAVIKRIESLAPKVVLQSVNILTEKQSTQVQLHLFVYTKSPVLIHYAAGTSLEEVVN